MRKPILITLATLGIAAVVAAAVAVRGDPAKGVPFTIPAASSADLEVVATAKVFFAHQSVGYNMLDAVPAVYGSAGVSVPRIVETEALPSEPGVSHVRIGQNGDPLGKIREFDRIMRSGMAEKVDVAILKLCYVDFKEGTEVEPVFAAYRDTLAALSRDYPGTSFVAATAPLTTERGPIGKLKAAVGRGDSLGPEHNVVRQHFNSLVRAEYNQPGTLFDIAAIQSTTVSGGRVTGRHHGDFYYAMDKTYASDPGHLNGAGAEVVTSAFISVVATALAS